MKFARYLLGLACLMMPACAQADPVDGVPDVRFAPSDTVAKSDPAVPSASLDDLAWFQGRWVGEVFGGIVEHRVMPAHDGHMPGLVRLRSGDDDGVFLYELSSFTELDGTLTYRNRLFGPDLGTVGDAGAVTDRALVALDAGVAYFDGITFAPDGADRAIVTFILTDDAGEATRHIVRYQRDGQGRP